MTDPTGLERAGKGAHTTNAAQPRTIERSTTPAGRATRRQRRQAVAMWMATIPPERLRQRGRDQPASLNQRASACWSGHDRI